MKLCHLPNAVRYKDRAALADLADACLGTLLVECADWSAQIEEFRSALVTSDGRTEWKVQTRRDRADIAAAIALVEEEMQARLDGLNLARV